MTDGLLQSALCIFAVAVLFFPALAIIATVIGACAVGVWKVYQVVRETIGWGA